MMRARTAKRWNTLLGLLTVAVWLGAALVFLAAVVTS